MPITHEDSGTVKLENGKLATAVVTLDAAGAVASGGGGGGGDASAANQTTMIAALAAIQTAAQILDNIVSGSEAQVDVLTLPALAAGTNNIGDVDVLTLPALVAGTANIGDVDVLTLPALPAGTNNIGDVDILTIAAGANVIGKVGVDQTTPGTTDSVTVKGSGYASAVSVTRPSNTNTYGAGDVVGATAAAITFANATGGAGEYMITSAAFERDVAALISGETSYTLHLYNVTPPSAFADEATFDLPSGDRAAYLGSISLGTPVDLGATLWVEQNGINKQVTALSTSLFGYLVTAGSHVAASASVHRLAIHTARI